MRFSVPKAILLESLRAVARFVSLRSPHPLAGQALLRVDESGLATISVADGEMWVTLPMDAASQDPGECLVSLRLMIELTRVLSGLVTISAHGSSVYVEESKDVFRMSALPVCEYFTEPVPSGEAMARIALPRLKQMIRAVTPSASPAYYEDCRPIFCGSQFLIGSEGLSLVSTDGRRLARITDAKAVQGSPDPEQFILPASILSALAQTRAADECALHVGDKRVYLESSSGFRLSCLKLEGRYPDYTKVIPLAEKILATATFARKDLIRAVRRALVFSQEKRCESLVRFDLQEHGVKYEASSFQEMSAKGSLDAEISGSWAKLGPIGFNGRFLLSALTAIREDQVAWDFQSNRAAAVLRPAVPTEFAVQQHVVMPVKLYDTEEDFMAEVA